MANPIQHAETTLERVHEQIQPYMADLFYKLANNYILLFGAVLLTNLIILPVAFQFLPLLNSTMTIIEFSLILLILVFGWRFLEARNHATALFVIYIRYSRQKRDLEATLALAKEGVLDDDNALYVGVDLLEESATSFLNAVEAEGLKAQES